MSTNLRENIDELIKHFWQNGYLTVSRKFGTYLPDPTPIGTYNVHAIARYKKKYAIGIILTSEDLSDPRIITKLDFLATRHTKYTNRKVSLFIGVAPENYSKTKSLVEALSIEAFKNIKIVVIQNKQIDGLFPNQENKTPRMNMFS